jgi:hypothetical protein
LSSSTILARDIVKNLEAALEQCREIAADFGAEVMIAPRRQMER